jgi:ergothioneine biosynthesis protein EgtB
MVDASPTKWHLAHTTWFFETMVLGAHFHNYSPYDSAFSYLFNSYYDSLGSRHPRAKRGLLSRPSLGAILDYRAHVDDKMHRLFDRPVPEGVLDLIELGCHHEQQHQELLLTDILHLFSESPLRPAFRNPEEKADGERAVAAPALRPFVGGIVKIGHAGGDFAFDCERPAHRQYLESFQLAARPVTNGEWIDFVEAGGYRDPRLWLSEGWARRQTEGWSAPLYWENRDGDFWTMSLHGERPVDPRAPVAHVSYFEANAYATWVGRRLPIEAEWEHAARSVPIHGNFVESGNLEPLRAPSTGAELQQMFGDVWEWTQSSFSPYPRFRAAPGAVGEYNGKFMSGQFVLRGGSCATPRSHMRASYRNFFPPEARWQFSGVRLAEDI